MKVMAGEQSQEHMQLYLEKQVPVSADASGNRTAAGVQICTHVWNPDGV